MSVCEVAPPFELTRRGREVRKVINRILRLAGRRTPLAETQLRNDLRMLLKTEDAETADLLRSTAFETRVVEAGEAAYVSGRLEISNVCVKDCHYCGIRRSNPHVRRFEATQEQLVEAALLADRQGFGSIVLEGGERSSERYVAFVEETLREIVERTEGRLAVTLSLGEQSAGTLRRWHAAGARRYLLRVESSNEALYRRMHPSNHSYKKRLQCLADLRTIGYQVGTGVLIGLPGQTAEDLVSDLLLMRRLDVDTIDMGPYLAHPQTPLGFIAADGTKDRAGRVELTLRMIALARLLMKEARISATEALGTLEEQGSDLAVLSGANVVMTRLQGIDRN